MKGISLYCPKPLPPWLYGEFWPFYEGSKFANSLKTTTFGGQRSTLGTKIDAFKWKIWKIFKIWSLIIKISRLWIGPRGQKFRTLKGYMLNIGHFFGSHREYKYWFLGMSFSSTNLWRWFWLPFQIWSKSNFAYINIWFNRCRVKLSEYNIFFKFWVFCGDFKKHKIWGQRSLWPYSSPIYYSTQSYFGNIRFQTLKAM